MDSPVKVARFGIASVVSIVEDRLIELMCKQQYPAIGPAYFPNTTKEKNCREKRITDYRNLLQKIVHMQVGKLRKTAFEQGSEILKYFEMLPHGYILGRKYHDRSGSQ